MYLTLSEADKIIGIDIFFNDTWSSLSEASKINYIKFASKLIDERSGWLGIKFNPDQEYEFPRDFSKVWHRSDNIDIYYANHGKIPDKIKKAT
ncbi:MAG: hypothetical protein PHP92_05510 [Candidatus Nanoarchaeia archaeon]|nr:hypothetical protein [Candidatus Nanoarchaeia archaeon]